MCVNKIQWYELCRAPKLIMIMILLIAFPAVASRIIIRNGIHNLIARYHGLFENWGFFIFTRESALPAAVSSVF
jgi:hypothetical protein